MDDDWETHLNRVLRALGLSSEAATRMLFSEEIVNFFIVYLLDEPFPVVPFYVYGRRPERIFNNAMQRAIDYLNRTSDWFHNETITMLEDMELDVHSFWVFSDAAHNQYFPNGVRAATFFQYCIHITYIAVLFHRGGLEHVFLMAAELIEDRARRLGNWDELNEIAEDYARLNPDYEPNTLAEQLASNIYFNQLVGILRQIIRMTERQTDRCMAQQGNSRNTARKSISGTSQELPSTSGTSESRKLGEQSCSREIVETSCSEENNKTPCNEEIDKTQQKTDCSVTQQKTKRNTARKSLQQTSKILSSTSGTSESSKFNEPSCRKEIDGSSGSKKSELKSKDVSTSSNIKHEPPSSTSEPPPKRLKSSSAQEKLEMAEQKSADDEKMSTDDANPSTIEPADSHLERDSSPKSDD